MAQFGTNCLSDFYQKELNALVGLGEDIEENEINSDGLTNLCVTDDSVVCSNFYIDWVALEKVHPVKNQGQCGSCWAFAAVLALESTYAIQNDSPVVALSEQ